MAVSISYGANTTVTPSSNVATTGALAIGTASSDRLVAACFTTKTNGTVSSVTIGGVSATKAIGARDTGSNPNQVSEIWVAAVPTGTTAVVVVTFSSNTNLTSVTTYSITGSSSTVSDTDSAIGAGVTISMSALTVPANGQGIACLCQNTPASAVSWTNATEQDDVQAGGGSAIHRHSTALITAAGTNTITCTTTGTSQALSGVTFAVGTVNYSQSVTASLSETASTARATAATRSASATTTVSRHIDVSRALAAASQLMAVSVSTLVAHVYEQTVSASLATAAAVSRAIEATVSVAQSVLALVARVLYPLSTTSRQVLQEPVDCVLADRQTIEDRGVEYDIRPADTKSKTVMKRGGRLSKGPAPSFSITTNKKGHD